MEVDLTDDDPIQLPQNKQKATKNKTNILGGKLKDFDDLILEIIVDDDDDDEIIIEVPIYEETPDAMKVSEQTQGAKKGSKETESAKLVSKETQNVKNRAEKIKDDKIRTKETKLAKSRSEEMKHAKQRTEQVECISLNDDTNTAKSMTSPSVQNKSKAIETLTKNCNNLKLKGTNSELKAPGQVERESCSMNDLSEKVREVTLIPNSNAPKSHFPETQEVSSNIIVITDDDDEEEVNGSFPKNLFSEPPKEVACGSLSKQTFKRKTENKCLNVHCKSGEELGRAPVFVLHYYGCKTEANKRELVCLRCFNIAAAFQEKLVGMLENREPLFLCDQFPINDIDVVDLESDEEVLEEEPPLPLNVLMTVEKELPDILETTLKRFDLSFQMEKAEAMLSEKMTCLETSAKEIDKSHAELQKEIERMRHAIYKDHEPTRTELPAIHIVSNPTMESQFLPPAPPPPRGQLQRLQHQIQQQHQHQHNQQRLQQQKQQQQFQQQQQQLLQQQLQQTVQSPNKLADALFGYTHEQITQPGTVALKTENQIQSKSNHSHPELSSHSQEVVALEQVRVSQTPLPPIGNLLRPKPRKNDTVYVMKMSFFGVWAKGVVMDVLNENCMIPFQQTLYKIKMETFGNRKQFSVKTVTGRHLAYPNPAPVRLVVGTRVIAVFQDDETSNQSKGGAYYSGLIAEPPKSNNGFRYLVFFDDGYAQYVNHEKILVVCESSRNVWDDIHPDSREFIRKYLEQYPERPMVKLASNQIVKTEWNGKWWIARVVEVDGSLVKMSFDADKRTEWIYRGSTRLAPLFTELAHAQARQESGSISRMRGMGFQRKTNQPYVEYTQNTGADDDVSDTIAAPVPSVPSRAVAKKSTAKRNDIHQHHPQISRPLSFALEYVGITKEIQLQDVPMPKRFQPHQCNPLCIEWTRYNREAMRGKNPLSIPLFCGWQRELGKYRKKTVILYTSPCGRRLRCMEDLHRYLRICKSDMSVDLFDFDFWVHALSEFALLDRVKRHITQDDISNSKENVPIPLVNYVDHSFPSQLTYSTDRKPYEGVPLNLDPEFLCGCDCTDDCQDKEKCACWQLTIQGSALCSGGVADPNVGYYYKRLQERVITGIYECNSQCKCSKKTCLNRVVQHPLQLRLQLFKTETKGWGLRCLNDVPKGTFICIYAGYLYTEATANMQGNLHGDEYLAELDYIEVVERMKEDYESDVEDDCVEDDAEDADGADDEDDDDNSERRRSRHRSKDDSNDKDFKIGWRSASESADGSIRTRLRKRTADEIDASDERDKSVKRKDSNQKHDYDGDEYGSDDEKEKRQPSSFTPKSLKKKESNNEPVRFQSVRKFYGPNERVYIMDANRVGNIGRYLNHSCNPNVFVQNVFVDTHDLRFPWVAFFALTYIKAGKELTWDYNYDVGSVPDKTIICQCGSAECRGRLL